MIHVIRHHVEQMLNAWTEFALVLENIKVILMLDADLNAFWALNVLETRHVSEINALIHALELAVRMLYVML